MKLISVTLLMALVVWSGLPYDRGNRATAADTSKVDAASRQVEHGAKDVGKGFENMGKGIGRVVVEGAKTTGETIQEAGAAAAPQMRQIGEDVKDGATSFGQGVKHFFQRLFGG